MTTTPRLELKAPEGAPNVVGDLDPAPGLRRDRRARDAVNVDAEALPPAWRMRRAGGRGEFLA